ncbi:MAG: hypothetical protein AAGB06_01370, partial [Verrucomicrobiota bacterium]
MPENHTQIKPAEKSFLKSVASLIYCNPFSSKRAELEQNIISDPLILGAHSSQHSSSFSPNLSTIQDSLHITLKNIRERMIQRRLGLSQNNFELYEQGVWFFVFHKYAGAFDDYIQKAHTRGNGRTRAPF